MNCIDNCLSFAVCRYLVRNFHSTLLRIVTNGIQAADTAEMQEIRTKLLNLANFINEAYPLCAEKQDLTKT